jgi:hypothetical protein
MPRELPRPFTMPWGSGLVVEEAAAIGEWHESVLQLLRFEDGSESIRFASYNLRGGFQRSPLIVSSDDLALLRDALVEAPQLAAMLRTLFEE